MKKITFKNKFESLNEALTKIPESYKVNGNEFIMSDGDQDIKMGWSDNQPKVLTMTEDMKQMKNLIEFDSRTTMTKTTINEKDFFNDFLGKVQESFDQDFDDVTPEPITPQTQEPAPAPEEQMPQEPMPPAPGLDPNQQVQPTDTEIKNNAFSLVQALIKDDPNAQELQSAINAYQGEMNTPGDESGYSDEMLSIDDYGDNEESLVDGDELNPAEYTEEPFDVESEEEIPQQF